MTLRHGLEIRAATAADAPDLVALLAGVGQMVDARDLGERLAALRLGAATALLAVQWGPPSGLLVMHWYPDLAMAKPVAQITTLLVGEEHRRQGIGRMLLKSAAQSARMAGCGHIEIVTASEASSLHAFCRATGFAEAGPRFVRSLRKQA